MNFWKKFSLYATLPEMRVFWVVLLLLIIILAVNFLYLPVFLFFVNLGFFLILAIIILFNNLRLARTNLEIKIERNELRSVISNLKDGVVAYDPNFRILIFNRAAEQIFKVQSNDVVGQYFSPDSAKDARFQLLTQVIFPSLSPLMVQRSEPGAFPQITDLSFEDAGLELRIVSDKITDPEGRLLGFVKLVYDQTREVELLRSKTDFISLAAHQLRTPLSAIHWALENLMQQPLGDEQKEITTTALGAAVKLLKIVNDLLDVSKIEEGRFGYKFEEVDIVNFIEETINEIKNMNKGSTVKIYFQKPEESPMAISVDPQRMKIAFLNLLDNAVKYNVQNGEVTVFLRRLPDKPFIEISVKDTGVGIPPEDMKKLFTKFFRAENVMKFSTEGSGLGLYIVRNIIKRHGGDVWAESEIDRGTTFYFTLPTDPRLVPLKEIAYGEM